MLKSLTLHEPWSSLLANTDKRVETRDWCPSYRGPVAIHSAKGGLTQNELYTICGTEPFRSVLMTAGIIKPGMGHAELYRAFPRGQVIAVGILFDCLPAEADICTPGVFDDYPELDTPRERAFGNYAPGRFAFAFTDVVRLKTTVPFKSRQGQLIELDRTAELAVREQWWQRCCPCQAESHTIRTHEVERGEHYCAGCNSIHDYREASH
jgi:activating signal cointegrator 1